jgi:hypothetical protein
MSMHPPDRPHTDPRGPDDAFDAALRSWAERPPRTPPEEAARRLALGLPERLPHRRWARSGAALRPALWLAAAAVILALGLAGLLGPHLDRQAPAASVDRPAGAPTALGGDLLVIELDPETTLYLELSGGDEPPS